MKFDLVMVGIWLEYDCEISITLCCFHVLYISLLSENNKVIFYYAPLQSKLSNLKMQWVTTFR